MVAPFSSVVYWKPSEVTLTVAAATVMGNTLRTVTTARIQARIFVFIL